MSAYDGDLEMLQWTTKAAATPCLSLIVHHTDGEWEYAYDRKIAARCGRVEQLDRG